MDRDHGAVYPLHSSVEYLVTGTLALRAYLEDTGAPLPLDNELIRDLLEVLLIDWLVSTALFKIEVLSGFSRSRIMYPKFGKRRKVLKVRDILAGFGENGFVKYLEGENTVIMFDRIELPEKLVIERRRYEDESFELELGEEPTRVRFSHH